MTIIVATDRMMIADSSMSQGDLMLRVGKPKIVRNPDGWLGAGAGQTAAVAMFSQWFMRGMPLHDRPDIKEDDFSALLLAPKGGCMRVEASLTPYRVTTPAVLGGGDAEAFVFGAIAAGADPEKAMTLALEYCVWTKGPLQIEVL